MGQNEYWLCRARTGLSQGAAAERLGISVDALVGFEEGIAIPDAVVVRRMAIEYGCSSDELLGLSDGRSKEDIGS